MLIKQAKIPEIKGRYNGYSFARLKSDFVFIKEQIFINIQKKRNAKPANCTIKCRSKRFITHPDTKIIKNTPAE